jgi:hypothetical protein
MFQRFMICFVTVLCVSMTTGHSTAADPRQPVQRKALSSLRGEVQSLKVEKVVWRTIQWKTCLLDGLKASREQKKPLMLWIFIDCPIDDERC